jgi:23S rRNA (adenine2030-N6)-methyltransferase
MSSEALRYDHRSHAGNAGDVWKHLVLAEVASHALSRRKALLYAESHAGYPEYRLKGFGEWRGGIGRCWSRLPALQDFCFFQIIGSINSSELKRYPGSTRLVLEIARKRGAQIHAEIWDIDQHVRAAWSVEHRANFHLGDGFIGTSEILDRSPSGLLLIDPPYIDEKDAEQAYDLLRAAEMADWTALCWQMMGERTLREGDFRVYSVKFEDIGLECGRWKGAVMTVAGSDRILAKRLDGSIQRFLKIMRPEQCF